MERKKVEFLYWETEAIATGPLNKTSTFDEYYHHLQQVLQQGIAANVPSAPSLSPTLLASFTAQMQKITLRTLIFEMALCDECDELSGRTAEEKYQSYARDFLQNPDYLRELYQVYPLMYEAVLHALGSAIQNITDVATRFEADREEINRRFYPTSPCRSIVKIGGGDSDSHRGGQRVYLLELNQGERLVYKPRSLALDAAYRDFVGWLFEGLGMPFWWNLVWERGSYGWCQWVEARSCESREDLRRYYQRNGILLAVSHLLGSEDLHYENLIAHGEHPVIVDLEMAVGSRGVKTVAEPEESGELEQIYRESVLLSGLLPMYSWNGAGEGVNVGAMDGRGGQLVPLEIPVVVEPGTVNMRVEYRRPRMAQGKNLATVKGEFLEPYLFLPEIQEGFARAYQFLSEHQEEALRRLEPFRTVTARYLVRDTQQNSLLLLTAGHPDFLRQEASRTPLWEHLRNGGNAGRDALSRWLTEQEIKELSRGDIPYFFYTLGCRDLYSSANGRWEGYFRETAFDGVVRRLKYMDSEDLTRQQKLIRAALLVGTKKMAGGEKTAALSSAPVASQLEAAEKIAELLWTEAIWSRNREEVGWISISMVGYREINYWIRPMNDYLYDGIAGVALFFAELAAKSGRKTHRENAERLVKQLFRRTDQLYAAGKTEPLPTGAYSGECSIAFVYRQLYALQPNPLLLSYLKKQCHIASWWLSEDTVFDVLGGNAGAALVLADAYELTGDSEYLAWAREAGERLLAAAVPGEQGCGWIHAQVGRALTGFAHGASGIMLALARLGCALGEEKYQKAAYQAYLFEEYHYQEERLDWADLRFPENPANISSDLAWCHGWGGIVMARLAAQRYASGKLKAALVGVGEFLQKKAGCLLETENLCLCHGKSGNAALLAAMGERQMAERWRREIAGLVSRGEIALKETLKLQECENYGLMGGITGLGYSCLRGTEKILSLLSIDTIFAK